MELENLKKSLPIIEKIELFISKIDELDYGMAKYEEEAERKKKENKEGKSGYVLIGAIFLGIVVGSIAADFLNWNEAVGAFLGVIVFVIIFLIVSPDSSVESDYNIDNALKQKYIETERAKNYFFAEIERACESEDYEFARQCVPEEYFDTESVRYLIRLFETGRADTFKEAASIYDEYLYRNNMTELQRQQMDEVQQLRQDMNTHMTVQNELLASQADNLKEIQKNTRSTVRATKVNAVIGVVYGHSTNKNIKKLQ